MNVVVTGGAGFIGSHLVEALIERGDHVWVIDNFNDFYDPAVKRQNLAQVRGQIHLSEIDICDSVAVQNTFRQIEQEWDKIEVLVHLAARAGVRPSIEEPQLYVDTNITGTLNLLEAARAFEVPRFVFGSSSSVYGLNKKVPFSETDLVAKTISPYAATKLAGEQLCSNYSELYGLKIACLRFFTVFGPRQRPDLAIARFVEKMRSGEAINKFGDGTTSRDYTYVADIVDGILKTIALQPLKFEIFNLGGSDPVSLNELIATIEEALEITAKINLMPDQPGDVPRTFADLERAQSLLGYSPQTSLRDGIQKYVEASKPNSNLGSENDQCHTGSPAVHLMPSNS